MMGCGILIGIKKDNHIDETKLDKREAHQFIELLEVEKTRHMHEKQSADLNSYLYHNCELIKVFFLCQSINHQRDMILIDRCIKYLKKKFGIK